MISALRSIFSRHGVPEVMVSDNGPQYSSQEMKEFTSTYGFTHITSSPHYPQSNGLAERSVQTVKRLLKKSRDPHLALLVYRATPFPWCGLSPAELLMGRKIRSGLPQLTQTFVPKWPYLQQFRKQNQKFKEQQKRNYNRRHHARPLSHIEDETFVWTRTDNRQTLGKVVAPADAPRSYIVDTPSGEVRRNRQHLVPVPVSEEDQDTPSELELPTQCYRQSPIKTRSKTGTPIMAPERLYHWRILEGRCGHVWTCFHAISWTCITCILAPILVLTCTCM